MRAIGDVHVRTQELCRCSNVPLNTAALRARLDQNLRYVSLNPADRRRLSGLLPPMSGWGSVSIVLATHNEGERLRRTVTGLTATAQADFEVIVVDDFSADGSIELLRASQPDVRIVIPPRRLGPPLARNFGAQFATKSW